MQDERNVTPLAAQAVGGAPPGIALSAAASDAGDHGQQSVGGRGPLRLIGGIRRYPGRSLVETSVTSRQTSEQAPHIEDGDGTIAFRQRTGSCLFK